MNFFPPTLTVLEIAERWAKEEHQSFMDMVNLIVFAVAPAEGTKDDHQNQKSDGLVPYPTICFNQHGHFDRFWLTKIVSPDEWQKKELTIFLSAADHFGWKTPEENKCWRNYVKERFSSLPRQETEELRLFLQSFSIRREDFKAWCDASGHKFPAFWNGRTTDKKKPRQRHDLLSTEIDAALKELPKDSQPRTVMKRLQEFAGEGSCILRKSTNGIIWKDSSGKEKELDMDALRQRLKRI